MLTDFLLAVLLVLQAIRALGAVLGLGRRRLSQRAGQCALVAVRPAAASPAASVGPPVAPPMAPTSTSSSAATTAAHTPAPCSGASPRAAPVAPGSEASPGAISAATPSGPAVNTAGSAAAPTPGNALGAAPTVAPTPSHFAPASAAVARPPDAAKPQEAPQAAPVVHLAADCTTTPPAPAARDAECRWVHEVDLGECELIGDGSYGKVFLCSDIPGFEGEVAVKMNRDAFTGVGSVGREAATLLRLGPSPFLVQVLGRVHRGTGECTGLIMPAADTSLTKLIARQSWGLCASDVVDILADVAGGLAEMHDADVAHLDIKPANVLIYEADDYNPRLPRLGARLCDLGLAQSGAELSTRDTSGSGWGTLLTMAPEVFLGRACLMSDIFGWAILAAWFLSGNAHGSRLYDPDVEIRDAVLNGVRPTLPPYLPTFLKDLITRAMNVDPLKRPSARQLHRELAAYGAQHRAQLTHLTLPALWCRPW